MLDLVATETHELLQRVFPELAFSHIDILSRAAQPRRLPPGIEVCRQGEPGNTMFIIGEGEVVVIFHPSDDKELVVDTLCGPAYFGEMALLGETTRTATIRTRTSCHMLEISHDAFLTTTDANPDLLRRLLRQIIGHLRRNDRAVIHELNEKNSELHAAYKNLAEQESLRTRFIATVSHELRTPLTAIQGYLSLLNNGVLSESALRTAMAAITRNVQTMVSLTNQMFLMYELYPEAPTASTLGLPDLIVDVLNGVRDTLEDSETAVYLNLDPNLPTIRGDKRTLTLAIRAVLENAFKFNPHRLPLHVHAYRQDHEAVIAVQDKGVGIPAEALPHIFEPFYRVEQEGSAHLFPGVGAGLTIAKLAVSQHNGRIEVRSEPGAGSTFTIFLPRR